MGLRPESKDIAREERLCRRAELAFGEALPPGLGQPVNARATESLSLSDAEVAPDIDWAEARRRQDTVDAQSNARFDGPRSNAASSFTGD
jgi:hypothetical protein